MTTVAAGAKSASAKIVEGGGTLVGIFVASTTSGTVKLWDSTTAAGSVILDTAILPVGFHWLPASFTNGIYLTVGATINVTIIYDR